MNPDWISWCALWISCFRASFALCSVGAQNRSSGFSLGTFRYNETCVRILLELPIETRVATRRYFYLFQGVLDLCRL